MVECWHECELKPKAKVLFEAAEQHVGSPNPFDFVSMDASENQNLWACVTEMMGENGELIDRVAENRGFH